MTKLKKLGPCPLPLERLMQLLEDSAFEYLREEDRILPRQVRGNRIATEDIKEELEKRGLEGDGLGQDDVSILFERPDARRPPRQLGEMSTDWLIDRLEIAWEHREEDAMRYGLRVGLVLGAHAQAGFNEEESTLSPLALTTVLGAMLDVAETLDTEQAMREASREERQRQWAASGKTWCEFAMPGVWAQLTEDGGEDGAAIA